MLNNAYVKLSLNAKNFSLCILIHFMSFTSYYFHDPLLSVFKKIYFLFYFVQINIAVCLIFLDAS